MFNSLFDASLLEYDEDYDNHVESAVFLQYYDSLARLLVDRFSLVDGDLVYDIGCGRGTFLQTLCGVAPGLRGVGIDPSCEPCVKGNVTLIRNKFSKEQIEPSAKLVILRHVLEHIEKPAEFLDALHSAAGDIPLFVEVPETEWIFRSNAFWDLCYEHTNYFTPNTLSSLLGRVGYEVELQQVSFEGQYQWAICRSGAVRCDPDPLVSRRTLSLAESYATTEREYLARTQLALGEANRDGSCAIWGMATKGVIFASLLPAPLLAGGVDSNARKQGRFAPLSGLEIHAPTWLRTLKGRTNVLVMNPNYLEEIRQQCTSLGIRAAVSLA